MCESKYWALKFTLAVRSAFHLDFYKAMLFYRIVHQICVNSFKLEIRFDTGEQLILSSGILVIAAIYGSHNFLAIDNFK